MLHFQEVSEPLFMHIHLTSNPSEVCQLLVITTEVTIQLLYCEMLQYRKGSLNPHSAGPGISREKPEGMIMICKHQFFDSG